MYLNRIRNFFAFILLISCLTGSLSSAPSSLTGNLFLLQGENVQSLAINQTFSENSKTDVVTGNTIACAQQSAIYGASVDAKIKLLGEASLVRVILIDINHNEYMIYEINSLLADNYSFSIKDVCHETKLLNAINPVSLRVDLLAASVELQQVSFVTTIPCSRNEITTLQNQIKTEQHQQRINLYNNMIKIKGEEWVAGPTEISMKTCQEKKCYFLGGANNPLPNTQGTEYYAGGVMPSRTNTIEFISEKDLPKAYASYVDTFDWRDRHGATESSSPYFNSAPDGEVNGWCTPIRQQGNCGSCYIFSSVGEAETKVNFYYNRQIDMDLSEQHAGSCSKYAGRMCNGGMPDDVNEWIVDDGIMDEESFEYTASNYTPCGDSADSPKEHFFFESYRNLKGNEVEDFEDLKKCIIKYGPLAGADLSISHAMTVVGYIYRNGTMTLIYKNSWGSNSGDDGYMYKASPYSQSYWCSFDLDVPASITGKEYTDDSIRCVDLDEDGYYNWGLGSTKPATCPEGCLDEPDCDDNDPEFGPYIDSTGECMPIVTGIALNKLTYSGLNYNCSFDPIRRVAVIRFNVPNKATASVNIYNLSGTLVKTLAINDGENGFKKAVWNSTNKAGLPVSSGIYVCNISVDNANAMITGSFKIAVSR